MKKHYPFISYPYLIERYLNRDFPEMEILHHPNKPTGYKKEIIKIIVIFFCAFVACIMLESKKYTFAIIILITILLLVKSIIEEIKESQKEHKKNKEQYDINLRNYYDRVQEQKRFISYIFSSNNFLENYAKGRIRNILSTDKNNNLPKKLHKGQFSKKGIAENSFKKYLNEIFENKIFTEHGYLLDYGNNYEDSYYFDEYNYKEIKQYIYEPDFIYYDKEVLIDIEIDEPYIFETKKPIHYFDEATQKHKDVKRNNYFNQLGWVVIRFSEKQVVENPYGCCLEIAELIEQLTMNTYYFNKLKSNYNLSTLEATNFWTEKEAYILAHTNYRDKYLNFSS